MESESQKIQKTPYKLSLRIPLDEKKLVAVIIDKRPPLKRISKKIQRHKAKDFI